MTLKADFSKLKFPVLIFLLILSIYIVLIPGSKELSVIMDSQLLSLLYLVVRILRIDKILRFRSSKHAFTDYFKGFEKNKAIKKIFGERTEEVLKNLEVEFTYLRSYMWISDGDGHLVVSLYYLNNGDLVDIYLDIIHELVHIRQFMEGEELFDISYSYVERPTEIEAYRHIVEEARNLGLTDERICKHLKTEWISDDDLKKLAKTLKVKCPSKKSQKTSNSLQLKLPIKRTKHTRRYHAHD